MTKRILISMLVCLVGSIGVVVVLFAISKDLRQTPGTFLREFPPHPVIEGDTLNLKYETYYISGGTPHTLYLGNYEAPLHLLVINLASLDTQHASLNVKGIMDQKFWSARVKVDSPYFYLTDGAVPRIYRGNVESWYAERYPFDSIHFNDIVPMSPDAYAVKSVGAFTLENVVGKITSNTPHYFYNGTALKKQVDGRFCTNGMLHFNKQRGELVYLYYYRNEFIVFDTGLNVSYRGRTIDTISRAQVKAADILSSGQHVLAAPALLVNQSSSVSDSWLFVNSNMLAKNELASPRDKGAVVDVYNLPGGKYKFSFYVYNYRRHRRMTEFRVLGTKMAVRYGNVIRIFDLRADVFR